MKIGFDARYIRWDHHDGISRFSSGLAGELAPLAQQRGHELVFIISDERQREFLPPAPCLTATAPTSPREPGIARRLRNDDFDVVFSPMQTMGTRGRNYRVVLTVHDLIYYRHRTPPPQFAWPLRLLWRLYHLTWAPQRLLLRRADAVVAVSATTAALIAEHHLTPGPVFVVPNAADPDVSGARDLPESQRERDAVYMGSFMPYKNVETLVRAFNELPDWRLHLLSRIDDRTRERLTRLAPRAQLVFHDGTPEAEYHALLGSARVLVTASRDEGFGIPLVEAMSHGTPVVVSDIPIFHEVCDSAAIFVDPDNASEFRDAILDLSGARAWRELSTRASARAKEFSWKRSAAALLDVLERTADA